MDYQQKYLKYKAKYLDLKKKLEGARISCNDLVHFWYKDWPDQGVPKMEDFFKCMIYIYTDIKERGGTSVIHCSGGIGRTGTVYIILKLMSEFNSGTLNSFNLIQTIKERLDEARNHRPQMVERVEQYFGIYQILMKYIDNSFILKDINRDDIPLVIQNNDNFRQLGKDFCGLSEKSIPNFYESGQDVPLTRNDCNFPEYGVIPYPGDGSRQDPILSCTQEWCLDVPSCKNDKCIICNLESCDHERNRYDSNPATTKYGVSICEKNYNVDGTGGNITNRKCYINADFMMDLEINDNKIQVIATQAPKSDDTIKDFKKMNQMYGVKRIIMLTLLEEMVYNKDTKGYDHKVRANDYFNSTKKDLSKHSKTDTDGYFKAFYKTKNDDYTNKKIAKTNEYYTPDNTDLEGNKGIIGLIETVDHENKNIFKIGIVNKNKWFYEINKLFKNSNTFIEFEQENF